MSENWKDYVEDDFTIVIDLDTPCFNAASISEETFLKVVHKSSGVEVYKDKSSKTPFRNVTEFKGRTKKKPTGWLGDRNIERAAKGLEALSVEDFEITTTQKLLPNNEMICYGNIKKRISEICEYLGTDNWIGFVGKGDNFRHDLKMPKRYKFKRAKGLRPLMLKAAKDYCHHKYGAEYVDGVEVDDKVNFYANASHKHFKKTGKHKYVVVSIDKDQFSYNGLYFNPYKNPRSSEWKHPEPLLVDGLGKLYMEQGKVKGYGTKWFMAQMLLGDWGTDGFSPTAHFNISFADKAVYNLLQDADTLKELVTRVYAKYNEWFPDGVSFKSWCGADVEISAIEWADTICKCAYMRRGMNDKFVFSDLVNTFCEGRC